MFLNLLKKIRMLIIKFINRKILLAGKGFSCGRGTVFYAKNKITIGNNTYIGKYCTVECDVEIGHEVLIANNVGIIGRMDHDYKKIGIPVRHSPCVRDKHYDVSLEKSKVIIGDDVWVGFGAVILSGVTIGKGAIVGAGSLVLNDVEPFSVVAGSPAKFLKMRFKENEIEKHIQYCKKNNYHSYSDL
jgi:acetyltransferase-like isoleucine patch superfamily enzyme